MSLNRSVVDLGTSATVSLPSCPGEACPCSAAAFLPSCVSLPAASLDILRQLATASPLDPDRWEEVLHEAEVPHADLIVLALRHGVPLTLDDTPVPAHLGPNHPMLYFDRSRVLDAIGKELSAGRYIVWPPAAGAPLPHRLVMGVAPRFQSCRAKRVFRRHLEGYRSQLRAAAVDDFHGRPPAFGPGLASFSPEQTGVKWRIITDCSAPRGSSLNDLVPESPYFSLPTAVQFARRLIRGSYIWKGDVESAFRLLPVRPRDWPALAFFIDGVLYVDTRLNFGHRLSPYYFVFLVGRPILYVALRRGASLLGVLQSYVDDFFGGADTYDKAVAQMTLWLQVCRDLGVPVSKAKTFLPSRVMEILGLIINTNTMTLSVSQDRLLDILDELEEFSIAKSVRRSDLESLAGKMVFACSVLPGGRTFMRELLDLLNATPRSRRWVRLSAGFRRDIEWWKNFAPKWNGVEAIPPPVTVPPTWLGTDASGDHGLGLFLLGLGIHIPLPLRTIAPLSVEERSLIIAETELMGVVLLAALAAPSFPGGHLLIPCDNTVAISWVDRGTARRPRAMRALRILWRVQARFRIHVSTRYISSERNALADSASRLDLSRFSLAASQWAASHPAASRSDCQQPRDPILVAVDFGATGGAAGRLAQYLVQGDDAELFVPQGQVDRVLNDLSALPTRFLTRKPGGLSDVPGNDCQPWPPHELELHRGLHRLFGSSCQLLVGRPRPEPSAASAGAAVPPGAGSTDGQDADQSGTVLACSSSGHQSCSRGSPTGPDSGNSTSALTAGVLGMPALWEPGAETRPEQGPLPGRHRSGGLSVDTDPAPLQDDTVCRAHQDYPFASTGRSALVPLARIAPVDLALATSYFPDHIQHAIRDLRRDTLTFSLPAPHQPAVLTTSTVDSTLLSTGLCPARTADWYPNRASHVARRLALAGSGHVIRGGLHDSQPDRRSSSPHPHRLLGDMTRPGGHPFSAPMDDTRFGWDRHATCRSCMSLPVSSPGAGGDFVPPTSPSNLSPKIPSDHRNSHNERLWGDCGIACDFCRELPRSSTCHRVGVFSSHDPLCPFIKNPP